MPRTRDTVLTLGMNDDTVQGLIGKSGTARIAYDAYRRFVQMFGDVLLRLEHSTFEQRLEVQKEKKGVELNTELDASGLKMLVSK